MNGQNKNVADIILEQLDLWGVKRIYGVAGDGNLGLLDALARQGEIQFIAVKHESVAAMAASAEAKLTGTLGVCTATMGPGLGNLLNGLGDAYMDKAPVLAITGQAPTDKIGTDYKQYVNQQELVKPFAQYSAQLAHPDSITELLDKAMHKSLTSGAVTHLSIPKDLFTAPTIAITRNMPVLIKAASQFELNSLEPAIDLMRQAIRPMIVAGIGAKHVSVEVEQLARVWGAGIVTSLGGKGSFAEVSSNLVGGIGEGGNPHAPEVLEQADVVLLAGDTWWPGQYVPKNTRIIQIDFEEENIGKSIPVELGIAGDTAEVIPLLTSAIKDHQPNQNWLMACQKVKQKWAAENEQEGMQNGYPVHPSRIIRAVENTIQSDAIIALDTGDVTVWFNRNFRSQQQTLLFSGDWRTMGFGLPAALAAKFSAPNKQVVALVGDGGLEMTLADLLTVVRYGLNITIVVFNNHALQMERDKMIVNAYGQEGVDLTNPDFVKIAEACGLQGYRVESDADLEEKLRQAISDNHPAIIEVATAPVVFPETKQG